MGDELDIRNTSTKRVHDADQDDHPEPIERSRFKRQRSSSEAREQENVQQRMPLDGAGHKNDFGVSSPKCRPP